MYEIREEAVLAANAAVVWEIVADVAAWPTWDPHELGARLDGPFATGTHGWSKPRGGPAADWILTEVVVGRSWSSRCSLPGGGLTGIGTLHTETAGRVRYVRTVRVTGPLVPLFRVWFGPRMRRDLQATFAALGREAERRFAPAA